MALDLTNVVTVTRRPGPLEVVVSGEGAGEIPQDEGNLVCRGLLEGLGTLDGLHIACQNRIPLGRGLGSSAATVCAGLAAANALGRLRWSPAEMLQRASEIEGHADNAAACIEGGLISVAPGPRAIKIPTPEDLLFIAVIPQVRTSTEAARRALPPEVPHGDAVFTVSRAIALALALERDDLEGIGELLEDRLHEPYRGPLIPGLEAIRARVNGEGCLGATISGSGPTVLVWTRVAGSTELAASIEADLLAAGHPVRAKILRIAPGGIRARWADTPPTALAKAPG